MMNIRKASIIGGSFIIILSPFAKAQAQTNKPNVIYIYADDMGKGLLSFYGQKMFSTPHIDSLFEAGVSFNNAYGCMLSAPSRASLLTGYHDCNSDKWNISPGGQFLPCNTDADISQVEDVLNASMVSLPEGDLYLPQVFKKAGYATAEIGKLEWGFTATRQQMQQHGWDYYYGYLDHVRCHGFYPPYLFDNGQRALIEGNTRRDCGKTIEPETEAAFAERWNKEGKNIYSQDVFLEKILQFIREHQNEPFFLYHPTQLPHGPVAIPEIDSAVISNESLTSIEKEYASMMLKLDRNVGIILQELRILGLLENTIIIFSSDNGHEIYYAQQGRCEKPYRNMKTGELFNDDDNKYYSALSGDVFDGNMGMAGLKRSNLEGGVHIPLTLYWKGKWDKHLQVDDIVSNYDMVSTFAEMLNVDLAQQKDGISILSLMDGKQHLSKKRTVIFASNYGPAIVNNQGWKLRYHKNKFVLYYLPDDPQERNDLSAAYPRKVKKLKKILLKACNGDLANGFNKAG